MDFRKNFGLILIILGMILTLNQTQEFSGLVKTIVYYVRYYWPLLIVVLGVYLLTAPGIKK